MELPSPSRRHLLSAGLGAAAAAVAGCSDAPGGEAGPGRVLHLDLSGGPGSLRDRYVVDLPGARPEDAEAAFEAALAGDEYTTRHRRPFFSTPDDPKYARRDGTYYLLGAVVVDEASETRPVLRLSEVDGENGDPGPETVAADDLPEVDRRAVEIAHMAARARGDEGGAPRGLVERGGYVYRRDGAVDDSRLLAPDGPGHVVFRDRRYAVEVTRERFHEPVYRATVQPVAETPERMDAVLRAKFVDARVARDDLSGDAREVLRAARGDGYEESHPYSEGYRAVLRALHERAYLDGNVKKDAFTGEHGSGTLLYDGRYFDYRLRFRSGDAVG